MLCLLVILLQVKSFGAVRILTFHYNQSDFIELQHKCLKKFLKDDFELIVFNDAKTEENKKAIERVCFDLDLKCVRFEPKWHLKNPLNIYLHQCIQDPSVEKIWDWHAGTTVQEIAQNPSVRHSHVIQFALDHYGYDHDDIVVIMDGDNFLIKPLSIRQLLGSHDLIGFNQLPDELGFLRKKGEFTTPSHLITPWVVFIAFNPTKIPNPHALKFHVDVVKKQPHLPPNRIGDTGGAIYRYLEKYPHLKIETYPWQCSSVFRTSFTPQELRACGISDQLAQFIQAIAPGNVQFFLHEHFLHFGAVSVEDEDHEKKTAHLKSLIANLVQSSKVDRTMDRPKIYDCFLFFNELDLLEIKLHELYDHVDHFVLVEAAETFRGQAKPLYFFEHQDRFAKFLDKIIYVKLKERLETNNPWDREVFQRNQILQGLTHCQDDDIVIVEDLDEIVRATKLPEIVTLLQNGQRFVTCAQTIYTYYLNRQGHTGWQGPWLGSVAAKYRDVCVITPDGIRQQRKAEGALANAGWHFTYMGGAAKVATKIESFSHAELDYAAYKDKSRIRADAQSIKQVSIDATFPRFVQDQIPHLTKCGLIDHNPTLPEPYNTIVPVPFDARGWYRHAEVFEELFKNRVPKVVIEVGCWFGLSTRHLATLLPPGGVVYAVDHWKGSSENQKGELAWTPKLPYLYEQFLSNVIHENLTERIIPVRMDSLEASRYLKDVRPDLIYIDASHDYVSVYADIAAWYPLIKERGFICGDDYLDGEGLTIKQAVDQFALDHGLTVRNVGSFWYYD
jgi:glycosyltransferase involved in cell wall biosynthesis